MDFAVVDRNPIVLDGIRERETERWIVTLQIKWVGVCRCCYFITRATNGDDQYLLSTHISRFVR